MTASPTLGPGPHRTTLLRAFVVLVPLFLCVPSCFGKEWNFHLVGDLAIQSTSISAGLLPCLSIPLSSLPCNSGISAHLAWPIDFSMISGNIPVAISHHLLRLCQDTESRISKPLPHQYTLPFESFCPGLLLKHTSESSPVHSPTSTRYLNLKTLYPTQVIPAVA